MLGHQKGQSTLGMIKAGGSLFSNLSKVAGEGRVRKGEGEVEELKKELEVGRKIVPSHKYVGYLLRYKVITTRGERGKGIMFE